jgi:hypothetical protein
MNSHSITANDEVLNAVLGEHGQEFFEVLTQHREQFPSTGIG